MSRKRSGFAITSVRGGNGGNGGGGASGGGSGSGGGTSASGSSRFRLVRLPAPGETFRRGRWICRDFYEREAGPRGAGGGGGRLPVSLDSPRARPHPHPPPPGTPGAPPAPPQPRSLGAFEQLVQALPPGPASPHPGGGADRLGLAGEESEEEGVGSGGWAIDNKIEQAMDLVKGHVLLAVREELEQLRERLQELRSRRAALERENRLLRALATPQQLARLAPPRP